MDWKAEIVKMVFVKQALAAADKTSLWPHHLPSVAAKPEEIANAEAYLGFKLDPDYRAFLEHANGWRGFYQTVDLFGTSELLGNQVKGAARDAVGFLDSAALTEARLVADDLFAIAATLQDRDLFVMVKPHADGAGTVVWFSGTEVQRFPSFGEYFLSMVDYNRRAVKLALQREHC